MAEAAAAAASWHAARRLRLSRKLEEAKQTVARIEDDLRKANALSDAAEDFAASMNTTPPAPSPMLTPQAMSELSDDSISARIDKVLTGSSFEEHDEYVPSGLGPVAPFITFEILLRVRNLVTGRSLQQRGDIRSALAAVVADFTGVRLPSTVKNIPKTRPESIDAAAMTARFRSRAMEIGSLMEGRLNQYLKEESRLRSSRKRSRDDDITALRRAYYVCPHGGTPPLPTEREEPAEAVPEEAQGMAQLVQAAGELAPRRGRSAGDDLYELA